MLLIPLFFYEFLNSYVDILGIIVDLFADGKVLDQLQEVL